MDHVLVGIEVHTKEKRGEKNNSSYVQSIWYLKVQGKKAGCKVEEGTE
jgi:hypothetical protein